MEEEKKDSEAPKPKRAVNSRGGGGMCPVRGHGKMFGNLDVAELAGLGKASEGKKRELLAIPDGYKLQNTGIRIEFPKLGRQGSNLESDSKSQRQFRGVVYVTPAETPTKRLRMVELPKRNEPSWNGLHVHLDDKELLVVQVQERSADKDGAWADSFVPVTVEPLKAFTVQDQDIAWLKTPSDPSFGRSAMVWAELSLQKKSSNIMEATKGANIHSKQRKISQDQIRTRQA